MQDAYLNYSFNPIFENGKIAGLFGPLQDVTSEVFSLRQLRDSEDRLARVLKSIGDAVIVTGIGGTGLGLWISTEIVHRHQGELRVRSSQQPGRSGTVFTMFLPFDAVSRSQSGA